MDIFDLTKFDSCREDNRREVKAANGGLPGTLCKTYSAFTNTRGGVIILGVKEREDGSWKTTGLKNENKLLKDFWNTINNRSKISINLLSDKDVQTYAVGENKDVIVVIHVPVARREYRPVYIDKDPLAGTYRRNWDGDYRCSKEHVRAMLRDSGEKPMDTKVLNKFKISDLNQESISGYRNVHKHSGHGQPFVKLIDRDEV